MKRRIKIDIDLSGSVMPNMIIPGRGFTTSPLDYEGIIVPEHFERFKLTPMSINRPKVDTL